MLQVKRDQLRTQIRKQEQEDIFNQKRHYIYKTHVDPLLLRQINKKILNGDQDASQIDLSGLVSNLRKGKSITESLAILINLTRGSDEICVTLIQQFTIIALIETLIKDEMDIKSNIELLVNLSNVPQFEITLSLLNVLKSCGTYDSDIVKLLSNISLNLACIDQTSQIYQDQYTRIHETIIGMLKELFPSRDQQVHMKALQTYSRYIEVEKGREFIIEDLRAIKQLLKLNQMNISQIQPTCAVLRNLWFKENEDFQTHLIRSTTDFILAIITDSQDLIDIVVTLELCASLFSNESCLCLLENTTLLFKIVILVENQYHIDIRKSAILALRMLADNYDELIIQMMAAENIFETLLDQLTDDQFDQQDQISILTIINIISQYFSVQNYDYPTYLERLALSENDDIAELSNLILKQFTDIGIIQ